MLTRAIDNIFCCNLDNGDLLREVTVKIGLERIDTQERITVEAVMRCSGHRQFLFYFIFFLGMMKRHVTLQSHDMSHDVMS